MAKVQGVCEPRFHEVSQLFQQYLDSGAELGASISVNIDGENVVDIYGGYADSSHAHPWTADTIACIWSTTKTVTTLAALMLIDRGLLSPDEKISTYWPEFAANGKQDVLVRHFLCHSSGVPGWDEPLTPEDIYDLKKSTNLLAMQPPWWSPGTSSGYHSIMMGHLIGELVHRTTGKSLAQFIKDEIAGPLNADFRLGAAESDWPRVAETIPPPPTAPPQEDGNKAPPFDPTSIAGKVLLNPSGVDASVANTPAWRSAKLGASNGYSNSHALSLILSIISLGGCPAPGKRFLSPSNISLIFQEQTNGKDLVIGDTVRFGLGYALTGKGTFVDWLPADEGKGICLWGGRGGSIGLMDTERKMTVTYVMNKMGNSGLGSERTKGYVKAVYKAIGVDLLV